ncbi:OsmC family protein [Corallococcus exercitus]|uniref:OsmC family protein n=1 Tax=Corallococcus exercitus TaxID=2316736 RepID=UPI0035D47E56
MTSASITEYETRLYWQGERGAVLTSDHAPPVPIGRPLSDRDSGPGEGRWDPEALLVGAVEGRTLHAFLDGAREAGVGVLFYQSCATARLVSGSPDQAAHFTDLIVRPHVAVASAREAEHVRQLFAQLPARCFPSSMLQLTPRIEPVVEVWAHSRRRDTGAPVENHAPAGSEGAAAVPWADGVRSVEVHADESTDDASREAGEGAGAEAHA